jgi:ABC-type tungstate transport system substrate-binding protein
MTYSHPSRLDSASKQSVQLNLLQALLAILLGNLVYFLLAGHLPLPQHRLFQVDAGLLVDFLICLALYALIRKFWR